MRIRKIFTVQFILLWFVFSSCSVSTETDPLPSWNEGETKSSIIDFVSKVTDKTSKNFVPIPERIAVFDNDGTLWCEQPIYFQVQFVLDRVKEMAKDHPEWKGHQPYKAVLENDTETLLNFGSHGLSELFVVTHSGMSVTDFIEAVKHWFKKTEHPKFNCSFTELIYQPMLELLEYLRKNGFKTYIVSGGGQTYIRTFAEDVYGIPPEQIIGTLFKTEFRNEDGKPEIIRLPEVFLFDDKEEKPVVIEKFIGRIPTMAFGNSDGDLQMLQYTQSGVGDRFMAIVHHTDGEREYAYDRESTIGKVDKAWDEAIAHDWTMIDMKDDWNVVFPFQLKK